MTLHVHMLVPRLCAIHSSVCTDNPGMLSPWWLLALYSAIIVLCGHDVYVCKYLYTHKYAFVLNSYMVCIIGSRRPVVTQQKSKLYSVQCPHGLQEKEREGVAANPSRCLWHTWRAIFVLFCQHIDEANGCMGDACSWPIYGNYSSISQFLRSKTCRGGINGDIHNSFYTWCYSTTSMS